MKSIVDSIFDKNIMGETHPITGNFVFYKKITSNEEYAIKNYINSLEQQLKAKDKGFIESEVKNETN